MKEVIVDSVDVSSFGDLIELLRPLLIRLNAKKLNQIEVPQERLSKISFIQYWSQLEPPKEIEAAFRLWDEYLSESKCISILRFNKFTALKWLEQYAPQFIDIFNNAIHPAMEADIFRIAFAYKFSCIWVDADHVPPKLPSKRHFNLSSLDSWSSNQFSSFLMKHWRINSPYINNSIFLAKENCPLIKGLANRILNLDPREFLSPSGIANFAGPKAFTTEADKLLSLSPISVKINKYGQVIITNADNEIIFSVSNLFRFLGARKEYSEMLGGADTWEYKNDKSLNWKLL